MATGNNFKSDLYALFGYWQNSPITHPKELIIETLRKFFSQDSYYHYVKDEWGYPLTPDQSGLINSAGTEDDTTSRIYIGENYRFDVKFFPALLIKSSSAKSSPISFNRNKGLIIFEPTIYTDGYGNETAVSTPSYFERSGAYEGSIIIDIEAKSTRTRDELCDLCSILFIDLKFDELVSAGIVVKNVSVSSPSEKDDRNDKLFCQSVTLEVRSEWRQRTYINNLIEVINFCCDLGNLETIPSQLAPNLTINTQVDYLDALINL